MLRSTFPALASLFILGFSSATTAEEIAETAIEPHGEMAKLANMLGEWTATTEMITPEGDWVQQNVDRVGFRSELGGLLITEEHLDRISGEGFVLVTDLSYDQYRDTYRLSAIGTGWGLMDIYEGPLKNDVLNLSNIRAGTSFPLDDGREMFFRLLIPVSGDTRVTRIDMSVDGGETWNPFYRVTHERIN